MKFINVALLFAFVAIFAPTVVAKKRGTMGGEMMGGGPKNGSPKNGGEMRGAENGTVVDKELGMMGEIMGEMMGGGRKNGSPKNGGPMNGGEMRGGEMNGSPKNGGEMRGETNGTVVDEKDLGGNGGLKKDRGGKSEGTKNGGTKKGSTKKGSTKKGTKKAGTKGGSTPLIESDKKEVFASDTCAADYNQCGLVGNDKGVLVCRTYGEVKVNTCVLEEDVISSEECGCCAGSGSCPQACTKKCERRGNEGGVLIEKTRKNGKRKSGCVSPLDSITMQLRDNTECKAPQQRGVMMGGDMMGGDMMGGDMMGGVMMGGGMMGGGMMGGMMGGGMM